MKGNSSVFAAMTHESAEERNPLLAYKAVNPVILHLFEAMNPKDQHEFKTLMEKEVNDKIVGSPQVPF